MRSSKGRDAIPVARDLVRRAATLDRPVPEVTAGTGFIARSAEAGRKSTWRADSRSSRCPPRGAGGGLRAHAARTPATRREEDPWCARRFRRASGDCRAHERDGARGVVRGTANAGRPALRCELPGETQHAADSSASTSVIGGRMPAKRCASIDLPVPGGPTSSALWLPAAAISSARRAAACP